MKEWWNSLNGIEQVAFAVAVIMTMFLIVQLVAILKGKNGKVVECKDGSQKVKNDSALTARPVLEVGTFCALFSWLTFALLGVISYYAFIPAFAAGTAAAITIELCARKKYAKQFADGTADIEEVDMIDDGE